MVILLFVIWELGTKGRCPNGMYFSPKRKKILFFCPKNGFMIGFIILNFISYLTFSKCLFLQLKFRKHIRDTFRTQSNIYDGICLQKITNVFQQLFSKKRSIIDVWHCAKYTYAHTDGAIHLWTSTKNDVPFSKHIFELFTKLNLINI